ncbi:methyltransferase domain-containing protein [Stenotrophomonas hibiscicola]|uniref:methyltransferase domain-containing protein n=1 Tax=Stenotrophomonas hibiscicola TaxID=86189 RepID=UPI003209A5BD
MNQDRQDVPEPGHTFHPSAAAGELSPADSSGEAADIAGTEGAPSAHHTSQADDYPEEDREPDPPLIQAPCPLCQEAAPLYTTIDAVAYHACATCDFIFADPVLLDRIDQGLAAREYDAQYWAAELASARQRSYGSSLARLAEALLYCTVPVERFIDIGTGPGYLLDAVSHYLPHSAQRFYGVEKYPPAQQYRTGNANYLCADLADVQMTFQCGICVEVLEHLTPAMAKGVAAAMANVSGPGSLFLFNTGLTDYVRNEDPGYLDPYFRGHVTCWSVTAARRIFGPVGFQVHPLPGKSWAFIVEMPGPSARTALPMGDRIWTPEPQNMEILVSPETGELMHILGRESARAYA